MDFVVVIAYGVLAAAVVGGGIALTWAGWRWIARREGRHVQRASLDRRRRSLPVAWDRRVRPRRLEDAARGFLTRVDRGLGAGTQ